jgi:hypothetical protein
MEQQLGALVQRIERLERANRAMKVVVAVAVAAVAAMTSVPQSLAKNIRKMAALDAGIITTTQINLVNGSGQLVAVLGSQGQNSGLVFLDQNLKWVLALGTSQNGSKSSAGLALFDGNAFLPGNGVARAAIGISGDGAGMVALDANQKPALVAGVNPDGSAAGAFVLDLNSYARAGFGNGSNGSGFWANDASNVTRYVAGVSGDASKAGSATFDGIGNLQLAVGGAGDGSLNGMAAFDANHQDRFDAGYSSSSGGGLLVKDAGGNITYSAP